MGDRVSESRDCDVIIRSAVKTRMQLLRTDHGL